MNWRLLQRRLHVSWLIAIAAGGVLGGAALSQYIDQTFFVSFTFFLSGLALLLSGLWHRRVYLIPLIIIGGFVIGLWRGSTEQFKLEPYTTLIGNTVTLRADVDDDVDIGTDGATIIRLSNILIDERTVAGKVWVSTTSANTIKRGDRVTIKGQLQPGFGSFSAAMYRADVMKVQRPEPGDVARRVRDSFADNIRTAIADPAASLGIGYLVGQRRALPPELEEALRIAGLTHVVVASGYNLTILVRLARRLFVRISKYVSVLAASGMIVSFIAVTGLSPSMSRAGLVTGLSLLAWYYGRKFHPLVLLPFAAAVTVLVNPSYAWGDLGWQLSFAAFGGVMIVAPLAQRYFFGETKPGTLRQILGETVAAQLCTLPILIYVFSEYSNVGIVANLLVLPLVPLAMLLTFTAGIGSIIFPALASIIGAPAEWLLSYMIAVATTISQLPWAMTELEISAWIVFVSYVVLILYCVYMSKKTQYNLCDSNIVE